MVYDVIIRSTGRYVPQRTFANDEFTAFLDTSDEWITERTGIRERHFSAPDERNSDMALAAARQCLDRAGVSPENVDLIIVPTVTPDTLFPATANWLQGKLGCSHAWSFDLNAGCSGFIYALSTATSLLQTGRSRRALVIGSEKMSALLDFTDRATCVLFGDAAACVLLEAVSPEDNPHGFGVREFAMGVEGQFAEVLYQPAGGSSHPPNFRTVAAHDHYVKMTGREVYKHAVRRLEQTVLDVLKKSGERAEDIDWFIAHQANSRIIETVQERMKLPVERFYINIQRYGNTTSATIPLCLDELSESGRLKPGDKLILFTFGTGLTWGSSYVVWGTP